MTSQADDPTVWGRVADDGTVYVRTADGERVIGSWQAGDPSAALSFFAVRYADLAAEVGLLETRLASAKSDAAHTVSRARQLKESLPEAKVVGDVAALDRRLAELIADCERRLEEERAAKAARAQANVETKRRLVDEAEQLARESTQWKKAGDRLREIATDWRSLRVDRRTDSELWARLRAARSTFADRRTAHFASMAGERESARRRKEKLVAEAKSLAGSSDWKPTAGRLKALMREWKAAGHAEREIDATLWQEFRAAQDEFFARLGAVNAERDEKERESQSAREALLAEAEAIDPGADLEAAQTKLRGIQERWEKSGRVPREVAARFDERLAAVTRRVRDVADAKWREASVASSPLVIRLRESVDKLESRLARARAAGEDATARETEEALATQRAWLAQAEGGSAES